MSEHDKTIVEAAIRDQWPGSKYLPLRGYVQVPLVREGGLTEALIKLAVDIADQHYVGRWES